MGYPYSGSKVAWFDSGGLKPIDRAEGVLTGLRLRELLRPQSKQSMSIMT